MLITTNLGYLGSDFDIDHSFSGLLPLSCSKRLEQVDSKCFTNYSIDDILCSNKTVPVASIVWEMGRYSRLRFSIVMYASLSCEP